MLKSHTLLVNLARQQTPALRRCYTHEASNPTRRSAFRTGGRANSVVVFVPQQSAYIVERFGRYSRTLPPGLAFLWPIVEKIPYAKSLKEVALEVPLQSAITLDNVTLDIDGVLYYRVVDPFKASYGVEDAEYAVTQLAQTTMRSEIGQLTLDNCLRERASLNHHISTAINSAAEAWGVECLRYEIRDIHPPKNVLLAMHRQVSAERSKRAEILESEGQRQSAINIAEGQKQSAILASEAEKARTVNVASGNAQSVILAAEASAKGLKAVAETIQEQGKSGQDALALKVAEQYVHAYGQLAQKGTSVVIGGGLNDLSGAIASAMSIYKTVSTARKESDSVQGTNQERAPNRVKERVDREMAQLEQKSEKELAERV